MKIFAVIFFVFCAGFFLSPYLFPAFAQTSVCPAGFENLCKINIQDNPNFFGTITRILIIIAIVASVIFLILGGIRWIMSGGDKGKVEQARSMVTAAIIGLVISLSAYFIVTLVIYILSGDISLNSLSVPRLID